MSFDTYLADAEDAAMSGPAFAADTGAADDATHDHLRALTSRDPSATCPRVAKARTALAKAQAEYDAARRALDAPRYSQIQRFDGYARVGRYNTARAAMRAAELAFDQAVADARGSVGGRVVGYA